jgi:hypothetical protein
MSTQFVEVTEQFVASALNLVLEDSTWVDQLSIEGTYTRRQDDTNGDKGPGQELTVSLFKDGAVTVKLPELALLHFSGMGSVKSSPRTRNALYVLAEAIRCDQKDRAQLGLSMPGEEAMTCFIDRCAPAVREAFRGLLNGAFWLRSLDTSSVYVRINEAAPVSYFDQELSVTFGVDGDAWIMLLTLPSLRFREYSGGGMSIRTRNALLVLAEAIRRDNEMSPQNF